MTDIVAKQIDEAAFGEVSRNWGWLLALGILFTILGAVGLGMTGMLTLTSVLFFGILLLIGGAAELIQAFKAKGWKSVLYSVLIAILYVVAGLFVINDPLAASATLTLFIAGALIAVGGIRIVMAVQMRGYGLWIWPLLAGVLSVFLGVMIVAEWPVSGLWIIGLFIAIEMIFHGWSLVSIALMARSLTRTAGATETGS